MFEKYFRKSSGKGKTDYQKDLEELTKNKEGENKEESARKYGYASFAFAGLTAANSALSVAAASLLSYPFNIVMSATCEGMCILSGLLGMASCIIYCREKEKDAHYNMHD